MNRRLSVAAILTGLACLGYYFFLGIFVRFGLDMSWIWLVVGGALTVSGWLNYKYNLPNWIRLVWRTALCLGVALVIGLECFVIAGMTAAPPENVDYLIILGARVRPDGKPSGSLRRRIEAAAQYLQDNPETVAIASGGQGADEVISEAECIRAELAKRGIPEDRILVEDQSTTTAENMAFSEKLMTGGAETKIGVVTSNYHVSRALKLAQKRMDIGPENIHGLAASEHPFTLLHFMMRDGACTLADALKGNL